MGKKETLNLSLIIDLPKMAELGLDLSTYVVAAYIHQQMTNPSSSMLGWCFYSIDRISKDLKLSRSTIIRILKKLSEKGLVERFEKTQFIRTTQNWYDCIIGIPSVNLTPPVSNWHTSTKNEKSPLSPITPNTPKVKNNTLVSKDTKQGNPDVERILKEFSEITELSQPSDAKPRQWAYLFAKNKGVEKFRPCLKFLVVDKKLSITKLETVYRQYPTFARDVLKEKVAITRKLTDEEKWLFEQGGYHADS